MSEKILIDKMYEWYRYGGADEEVESYACENCPYITADGCPFPDCELPDDEAFEIYIAGLLGGSDDRDG